MPRTTTWAWCRSGSPMSLTEESPSTLAASTRTVVPGGTRMVMLPRSWVQLISTSRAGEGGLGQVDDGRAQQHVDLGDPPAPPRAVRLVSASIAVTRSGSPVVHGGRRTGTQRGRWRRAPGRRSARSGRRRSGPSARPRCARRARRGDPALGVRGVQHLGHLVAVGVGGPQLAGVIGSASSPVSVRGPTLRRTGSRP